MADWTTISSLATAGGTMVLGVATFASVRTSSRAARIAEQALQVGLRPVLMPSRREDPPEKLSWGDGRWTRVEGGHGSVELSDDAIYLAMSLRNVGSGIAVLHGWHVRDGNLRGDSEHPDADAFRRQGRDLYVPPSDSSFWQGALRDPTEEAFDSVRRAVTNQDTLTIHLLYGDHEGGQRAISRFNLNPVGEGAWLCSVIKHWNLDRRDPR
jgi:hypothetical protein